MSAMVRPAAVAGTFYPGRTGPLRATVDGLLAEAAAHLPVPPPPAPKALIAPHAGYVYSGPVAASAYARLAPVADRIERVVLLGPAHRAPVRTMALSSADAWETPLGTVALDGAGRVALSGLLPVDDRAHAPEHSLEVHVPFLQRALRGEWALLPIIVGHPTPDQVADVLDLVWGGDETLIVVSTDLSHYLPYDEAATIDRRTAAAIVARSTAVRPDEACGAYPVTGLLAAADRHHLEVELVDLRCSGDTAGPRDQVVGYGAFVLR